MSKIDIGGRNWSIRPFPKLIILFENNDSERWIVYYKKNIGKYDNNVCYYKSYIVKNLVFLCT